MNDNLSISVLASSSSGNVTYVETGKQRLLIDAGLSGKKIEKLMASIDRDPHSLTGIFVTHEHSDHCRGVGVMARRYGIPVYANKKTWAAMASKVGKIPLEQRCELEANQTLTLGDCDIESFAVKHDAADPQFYSVHFNDKTFTVLTDTGTVDDHLAGVVRNADAYLFECNHDQAMLEMGRYPWSLKRRIMSPTGHLSNDAAADALMDVLGLRTKHIYLGHLSQENNQKELAQLTVSGKMRQNGLPVNHDFYLHDTDPNLATNLIEL